MVNGAVLFNSTIANVCHNLSTCSSSSCDLLGSPVYLCYKVHHDMNSMKSIKFQLLEAGAAGTEITTHTRTWQ